MFNNLTFRWITIIAMLAFASFKLYPTIKFYGLSEEEKTKLLAEEPEVYKELENLSIKLGLDLQGGMHVVLEVDMDTLALNVADSQSEELRALIHDCAKIAADDESSFFEVLEDEAMDRDFRLIRYYHKLGTTSDNASVVDELRNRGDQAVGSALEIIRNRVDEFGVAEPVIQRSGHNRIIVELAGVKDTDRARNLIRSTALLEFNLVRTSEEFSTIIQSIDEILLENAPNEVEETEKEPETTEADSTDIFSQPKDIFSEAIYEEADPLENFSTSAMKKIVEFMKPCNIIELIPLLGPMIHFTLCGPKENLYIIAAVIMALMIGCGSIGLYIILLLIF